jgi:hypothetical protein
MKNNLGSFLWLSRLGAGAVAIALCAFAPGSRADVIVNNVGAGANTGQAGIGSLGTSAALAQVFTMPTGISGDLTSLTFTLVGTGQAEVWLYGTSSGTPDSGVLAVDLGHVDLAGNTLSGLSGNTLSASTSYAIVLSLNSGSLNWQYTDSQGTVAPTASWGDSYTGSGISWTDTTGFAPPTGSFYEMTVQAVPEVPITGLVMGFGALAIGLGYTLRRKLCPAV